MGNAACLLNFHLLIHVVMIILYVTQINTHTNYTVRCFLELVVLLLVSPWVAGRSWTRNRSTSTPNSTTGFSRGDRRVPNWKARERYPSNDRSETTIQSYKHLIHVNTSASVVPKMAHNKINQISSMQT